MLLCGHIALTEPALQLQLPFKALTVQTRNEHLRAPEIVVVVVPLMELVVVVLRIVVVVRGMDVVVVLCRASANALDPR